MNARFACGIALFLCVLAASSIAAETPGKQRIYALVSAIGEQFVEMASARALNDQQGEVIIREQRIVNPSTPK